MSERISAYGGRVFRDEQGIWRHTDTGEPVPGAQDLTLTLEYPDLVVVNNEWVLVPDALVRENEELAWVRESSSGRTSRFDREQARGGPPTPGWGDVWPVSVAEWDLRSREVLGILVDGWVEGHDIPRSKGRLEL